MPGEIQWEGRVDWSDGRDTTRYAHSFTDALKLARKERRERRPDEEGLTGTARVYRRVCGPWEVATHAKEDPLESAVTRARANVQPSEFMATAVTEASISHMLRRILAAGLEIR